MFIFATHSYAYTKDMMQRGRRVSCALRLACLRFLAFLCLSLRKRFVTCVAVAVTCAWLLACVVRLLLFFPFALL